MRGLLCGFLRNCSVNSLRGLLSLPLRLSLATTALASRYLRDTKHQKAFSADVCGPSFPCWIKKIIQQNEFKMYTVSSEHRRCPWRPAIFPNRFSVSNCRWLRGICIPSSTLIWQSKIIHIKLSTKQIKSLSQTRWYKLKSLTFLPALLLCRFIKLLPSPSVSLESANRLARDAPDRTSAEQPPHFHPFPPGEAAAAPPPPPPLLLPPLLAVAALWARWDLCIDLINSLPPRLVGSQPQELIAPWLHAWAIAYVRPELHTAYR